MRTALLAVLIATLAMACPPDTQAGHKPRDGLGQRVQDRGVIALDQVLRAVRGRFPGRLLNANMATDRSGRPVYVLRILQPDGRIVVVVADATNGRILDVSGGAR